MLYSQLLILKTQLQHKFLKKGFHKKSSIKFISPVKSLLGVKLLATQALQMRFTSALAQMQPARKNNGQSIQAVKPKKIYKAWVLTVNLPCSIRYLKIHSRLVLET